MHLTCFSNISGETKGQRNKSSFIYVIFSSLLQLCLALFCMTEVLTEVEQVNQEEKAMHVQYDLYILASLGSLFGFLSQLISHQKSSLYANKLKITLEYNSNSICIVS